MITQITSKIHCLFHGIIVINLISISWNESRASLVAERSSTSKLISMMPMMLKCAFPPLK